MLYYNSFTELCQEFFPYNSHIRVKRGVEDEIKKKALWRL